MTNIQTITLNQAEFAAYQRAVELAKAEIARLTAELAGMHRAHEQQQRALEAERRARQIAEADMAALTQALSDRHICENCGGKGSYWTDIGGEAAHEVCECWIAADQMLAKDHPGAALLAELDAARAVVAAVRVWLVAPTTCLPIAKADMELVSRILSTITAYDAAVKASEP